MISATDALQRLQDGNRRFVSGEQSHVAMSHEARRLEFVDGQAPVAVVLGCADSRVPVEIVFDQGLGDLFVIRVAGNIVAPSQIGSVEFAAERFGTPLVIVLGHTGCGAVLATLDALNQPAGQPSQNLGSIVNRIRPSVEGLLATDLRDDPDALAREAVRANVRVSVEALRHGSALIERLIQRGALRIVGAEYALETDVVTFLDGDEPAAGGR
jgi:carbonic anhydrase